MKMLQLVKNGEVLIEEVEDASSFFRRFMGLMYRRDMAENHGLLLTPCNEIHTFGMRFDIDTVALSKDGEVLFIDRAVPPHKVRKKVPGGHSILELCSGVCDKIGISVGDTLEFVQTK